jgi:hypothetical protein
MIVFRATLLREIDNRTIYMIDSANAEWIMFISDFVLLGTLWYLLQSIPGLLQAVGYVFGLVLASWTFDQYFPSE